MRYSHSYTRTRVRSGIARGIASCVNEQSITRINIWSKLRFARGRRAGIRATRRGPQLTRGRDARRRTAAARCQRAITNSEGGRCAATLYARRRILHSVFSDTMGRGVRVLKYEYEYGRRARGRVGGRVSSNRALARRRRGPARAAIDVLSSRVFAALNFAAVHFVSSPTPELVEAGTELSPGIAGSVRETQTRLL